MEPYISIVIPFYCTPAELFNKCMTSILSAKIDDIEVLVIDDGSPEAFYSTLNQYADDARVRIIHKKNAGVSSARNMGIREAKGQWVMFVDSDDYIASTSLKEIERYARKHEVDILIFSGGSDNNGIIDFNTSFLKQDINYAENRKDKLSLMESALAVGMIPKGYKQYFSLGAPYCKLLRVSFLRNNHLFFDENVKFAEDTLFSLHLYQSANNIKYLDTNAYYYVNNSQSVTRRFRPGLSEDMDVFFNRTSSFLKDNNLYTALEYAYLLRVEFEMSRVFRLEFFNPENSDRNRKKKYLAFIRKEPYRSALERHYLRDGSIRQKFYRLLVRSGHGDIYYYLKKAKNNFLHNKR